MNTLIVLVAKDFLYLIVLLAIVFFFLTRKEAKKELLKIGVIAASIAYSLAKLASLLYNNPRPFAVGHFQPLFSHSPDNGFPSDHMLLGMTLAAVIFTYNKKWGLILGVLALIVGWARVLAGVHHAVDIVGAALIAVLATYIALWVAKKFLNKI